MCNFQVLSKSFDGYIVLCQDCKMIQLAFGTAMFKVNLEHFHEVVTLVRLESNYRAPSEYQNLKHIFIPLDEGMMLCLTSIELQKLEHLLDEATALFETYQILQLNT